METEQVGREIAGTVQSGDLILLTGELGAGKTCLVRGILDGLRGEGGEEVKSPSYTILNIYEGLIPVYHFDFYRVENSDDIELLGLDDYWGKGVCIVEWPKEFCNFAAGRRIDVIITIVDSDERQIEIRRGENV